MGYLAPGEMCDNMLQLMRFSVSFEGILNTNNGYFHIKIMIINGTHTRGLVGICSLRENFKKNPIWCVLMFLCILY